MASVIVFDVNETLLDLAGFDSLFEELFGDSQIRNAWFAQMLNSAFVSTITSDYHPFGEIGGAAFKAIAQQQSVDVEPEHLERLGSTLRSIPLHPDSEPGLHLLAEAGFRLVALTNSTLDVATDQLENSGVASMFETILSADAVRRLKPAMEPYMYAANELNVFPGDCRMVASHGWDIYGALEAGFKGAFVARPGKILDPVGPQPDIVGEDILAVANAIVSKSQS